MCDWSIYSSAFTPTLPHSIFTASLFLSTLYSLHVYISFTGKSSQLAPCQCLCFGECCPLFPAFYHLNFPSNQLIYFLISVFLFFFSFCPCPPPLFCPELAASRLRIKRNGRSESAVEEEAIGKAQNGTHTSKLESRSGPWCRKVQIIRGKKKKKTVRQIDSEWN